MSKHYRSKSLEISSSNAKGEIFEDSNLPDLTLYYDKSLIQQNKKEAAYLLYHYTGAAEMQFFKLFTFSIILTFLKGISDEQRSIIKPLLPELPKSVGRPSPIRELISRRD